MSRANRTAGPTEETAIDQGGPAQPGRSVLGWPAWRSRLLLVPLLFGSGCSMINHKVEHDPLRGDVAAPSGVASPIGTQDASQNGQLPANPPPNSTAGLPSLPPPMLNLTPASLAGGVQQSVNPNSPYQLASNTSRPDSSRSDGDSNLTSTSTPSPSPVQFSGEIVPDVPGSSGQSHSPSPENQASNASAWEQINTALKSRKILWRKGPTLVPGTTDTYSFACAVPVAGSPMESTVYEKSAPGEGGLAVIRAVIADIDQASGQ